MANRHNLDKIHLFVQFVLLVRDSDVIGYIQNFAHFFKELNQEFEAPKQKIASTCYLRYADHAPFMFLIQCQMSKVSTNNRPCTEANVCTRHRIVYSVQERMRIIIIADMSVHKSLTPIREGRSGLTIGGPLGKTINEHISNCRRSHEGRRPHLPVRLRPVGVSCVQDETVRISMVRIPRLTKFGW